MEKSIFTHGEFSEITFIRSATYEDMADEEGGHLMQDIQKNWYFKSLYKFSKINIYFKEESYG